MPGMLIDIGFCLLTYAILIRIILWRKNIRRRNENDNDDEGGLPVFSGPELDLPPGVCLPINGPKKPAPEEEFA